ncbi:MAG: helix-turn-helix domain-containing protein [Desulfarculales bacterium]|jgi:hypothetical protein|nr:helix-turn-helix domain-containing protein [Desulfarculales bacterium]
MENNIIMLSNEQREKLSKYARTGVHGAMQIRRAKAILALDRSNKKDHLRLGRICEALGLSRQGLNEIRKDFMASSSIEEFLTRKKRKTSPVPAKITGEVEARIVALACGEPPQGYARWTVRLLAEKIVELRYLDSLSHMSVDRLLKKRNISLT